MQFMIQVDCLISIDVVNVTILGACPPDLVILLHADVDIIKRSVGAGCELGFVNSSSKIFGKNFILQLFVLPRLLEHLLGKRGFEHDGRVLDLALRRY